MKITIKSRYLVFPVNVLASKKKVSFINNDEILYELNLNLDNISPDFEAYVDVSRSRPK